MVTMDGKTRNRQRRVFLAGKNEIKNAFCQQKKNSKSDYRGGAYKDWPEDRPETIFLQKWTGQDRRQFFGVF